MKRAERITGFVEAMWEWYGRHKRTLPWRDLTIFDENERAYFVLVSEIMLQQTQVSRVQNVFKVFSERFSSLKELSQANYRDVLLEWRGMGYNNRALRLRDAVRMIQKEFGGIFPQEMKELQSIKGIGPYTAAAIRNFAWNIPTPCIDTNIRRILHRTFYGPENSDGTWRMKDHVLLDVAAAVLDQALVYHPTTYSLQPTPYDAANWHAALMDFGSLVQTKNAPKWEICPLTRKRLMKTTPESFARVSRNSKLETRTSKLPQEPGRFVGTRFIPNRIFRGRIIEALRDSAHGMKLTEIGRQICIDWDEKEHREWLLILIKKLTQEGMIERKNSRYGLAA